jgi:hypothetical protein
VLPINSQGLIDLFGLQTNTNNLEEVVRNLYQIFFLLDSLMVSEAYFIVEDWGNSSLAEALKNRLSKVLLTNPI